LDAHSTGVGVYFGPLSGDYEHPSADVYATFPSSVLGFLGPGLAVSDTNADGVDDLSALAARRVSGDLLPPELYTFLGPISASLGTGDADVLIEASDYRYFSADAIQRPTVYGRADLDSDGYPDVLLAGEGVTTETQESVVWVLPGPATAGVGQLDDAAVRVDVGNTRRLQVAVLDINGDDHEDLIVADGYRGDADLFGSGRVFLLLGPLSGVYDAELDADGTLEGSIEPFETCETDGCEHPGSLFGFTVENAGDVDDDGFEDLLIGAPGYELDTSTNDKGPGAVYLFRGGD
jgi:hypothetical protein